VNPDPASGAFLTFFFDVDPGWKKFGYGMEKIGSINIPDPQHCLFYNIDLHVQDDPPLPEDDENKEKRTDDISSWDADFLKVPFYIILFFLFLCSVNLVRTRSRCMPGTISVSSYRYPIVPYFLFIHSKSLRYASYFFSWEVFQKIVDV
jgi:hypothetical protein